MIIREVKGSRRHGRDLLVRPPCGDRDRDYAWEAMQLAEADQLGLLDELRRRGLLSDEEYEAQRARVFDR